MNTSDELELLLDAVADELAEAGLDDEQINKVRHILVPYVYESAAKHAEENAATKEYLANLTEILK